MSFGTHSVSFTDSVLKSGTWHYEGTVPIQNDQKLCFLNNLPLTIYSTTGVTVLEVTPTDG